MTIFATHDRIYATERIDYGNFVIERGDEGSIVELPEDYDGGTVPVIEWDAGVLAAVSTDKIDLVIDPLPR